MVIVVLIICIPMEYQGSISHTVPLLVLKNISIFRQYPTA